MFKNKLLSMVLLAGMLLGQTAPHALAATYCDHAQFVSDITAPDGANFAPGETFTKTWRFSNVGTCVWTTSYSLVWVGGDSLGAPFTVKLPVDVRPGQMLDISVNLTAPMSAGHYKGLFKFSNASDVQFGIGDSASDAFWADIDVIATDAVIYDFVANAVYAKWRSGAGPLPYPGTSGDRRGFSYQVDKPHLEDDSFDSLPGLLFVPQNKYNGYIQATFPEFQVQQGDKLQTLVNCEFGATGCYVTFRIDYLLPNGLQKTLWSFREAYDKRFYRADIDLSWLAGQRVRFVFMLLSSGFASGDRALWGSPRIIRTGMIQPPAPPATLTPLPPLTPTQTPLVPPPPTVAPSSCDRASFVTDVNIPDGTIFAPGAAFSKTWRLKNSGYCTWTTAYKLMYYSGEQMSAPTSINIPWNVYSGQTVDLTINMIAPNSPGEYRGFWILANSNGTMFGIGVNAANPFWVEINVTGSSPIPLGYDFTANACSAQWKSGAGPLPCPSIDGDLKGFVLVQNAPILEDGSTAGPGLITFPQYKYNGYIQGFYPTFTVQPGDRFQVTVGCAYGSSCYVTYRLDYMNPNGYIGTFWTWREQNNGQSNNIDVNLTPLAGRSVRFILTILATGYASNDRAVWGSPRIFREGGTLPTVTPIPPTNTSTPTTDDWLTYTNSNYGFQFRYPPEAQIYNQFPDSLLMNLPIIPGTNLVEKYLQTTVIQNTGTCQSPLASSSVLGSTETVVINGISFLKQTGGDAGAGNFHDWVAYSTARDNTCVSMGFVLHYLNAGSYDPPKPEFDRVAESAVFLQMMSTFMWLAQPPTATSTPVTPSVTPVPPTLTPVPGTVVPSPNISSLHMIDSANGWAIGDSYLLRTTDGGITWYSVLPGVTPVNGYFPSSSNAWVISNVSDHDIGSLYRTSDGGQTWTHFDIPFNGGFGSYIQFLDDNTGYVLQITGAATNKQSVSLYKTTDGGATWTQNYNNDPNTPGTGNTLPLGGHKNGMTFRDTTTGWVGGDYPSNGYIYLYKTTDSGVTWSQASLPLPIGYESAFITITTPKFFGTNDGVLPVWMTIGIGTRDLFLYTTHDGGTTWIPSSGFARNAEQTDIIWMGNVISWDWANVFHVTNDSGNTWNIVTPNVNFGDDFRELDFISTTTGWVRQQHADGSTSLYRTTDGGSTWALLFGAAASTPSPTQILPTPTSPVALLGPYAVIRVGLNDALNVHSGAGTNTSVIGSFPPNATNVMKTGATASADGAEWWEVQNPSGGTGWVNSSYLTEYASHDVFCADTRISPMIVQLKQSMNNSDGNLFGSLVSPKHGVNINLWAYQPAVNFSAASASSVFTDATVYNWGAGPRGEPDYGTFAQIIQPRMLETLNAPSMETYCDDLTKVYPLATPWPYTNIHYYNLYKPASGQTFDFRTWLIGFEYIDNQPYIYGMVTIVWEP